MPVRFTLFFKKVAKQFGMLPNSAMAVFGRSYAARFILAVLATLIGIVSHAGQFALAANSGEEKILAEIAADLNGDGIVDRAEIVSPLGDDFDNALILYLADETGELELVHLVRDFVWGNTGVIVGQEPGLEMNAIGSLVVSSQNQAIGRNRWQQRITIAFRNGAFKAAGYTYSAYDTLDPEGGATDCDLNLLTGKGFLDGKEIRFSPGDISIMVWKSSDVFALCGLES